ncbi:MAG TPA: cytochrome P450 [Stellaceae bacterium]|jgi:cytochrome P450|nr:cytochrome P450 [Stellaceae bacterium]
MSSTTFDVSSPAKQHLPAPRLADLAHIPGSDGAPLVGDTFRFLADPYGWTKAMADRYGLVYRNRVFGVRSIALLGPEAVGLVLFDQSRLFSSLEGWGPFLGLLFPRGLMLRDFDDHRLHRRALSVAFKVGPLKSYLAALNAGIAHRLAAWRERPCDFLFYPAIKQLTLDLAAASFLGAALGSEVEAIKGAFIDMVAASIAVIRRPLPFTAMRRGVTGRARIVEYFGRQVPLRRERGGEDLFSQLCRATHEDGSLMSVADIADHMSFLMMAAHDTLTSSLSAFVYFLAAHPEWQERLRAEVQGLGLAPAEPLPFERLEELRLTEMAFKEAMRLIPPVISMPRRAMRDFEYAGYRIPAGTPVNASVLFTHRMAEHWPDPQRFDPLRFSEENARGRHKFAFAPFGAGAHMCLGLHFAYMQAKCFARHLLERFDVSLAPGYAPKWQMAPIPKPKDGLKVTFTRRD